MLKNPEKIRICPHLLNKTFMENFIFCAVLVVLMEFWGKSLSLQLTVVFTKSKTFETLSFESNVLKGALFLYNIDKFSKMQFFSIISSIRLILFHATVLFLYLQKHQKTTGLLMFSGGIERYRWYKLG